MEFNQSEATRIAVIVMLAAWFARWQTEVHTFWRGRISGHDCRAAHPADRW